MRWQILFLLRDFVVAPQTFFEPKPLPVAERQTVGSKVPDLPHLERGRPAVVAFLRHVGCPFAEATVRRMTDLAAQRPAVDFAPRAAP